MIPGITGTGKRLLERLAMPLIVVLVGLAAFGLGRLSALEEQKGVLKVYEPGQVREQAGE